MNNISENFLTAEEVSNIFRIPLPTIYRLTQQSRIKAVKIGKHWRYKKEDVERYLQFGTDFSREPARRPEIRDFNERRAYPRINTNFRCTYSVNIPPFKMIKSKGIIKNLSAGGVFFVDQDEGIKEIEVDDPIELSFFIERLEISAKGKVVRKAKDGLGIKFKNIGEEAQEKIMEYAV